MYAPRPKSPYGPPPSQSAPQITPGSLTYTTSVGPDGRTIYQPFKAVAASYQTPNGIVHGIQWVPAEATQIFPQGAQPASPEFAASWERAGYKFTDANHDWQREDDKKRKKREKEETKARERRKSFVGPNPPAFPTPPSYPSTPYVGTTTPYGSRDAKLYDDMDRQFGDMGISGRSRTDAGSGGYGNAPSYPTAQGPYSKPYPSTGPHISAYANPSPNMRAADVLPTTTTGYPPASPYSSGVSVAPMARAASPQPPGAATSAYGYPQPSRSRATTPVPGSAPSYQRAPSPMPSYPRSRPVSPMPVPEIPSSQPTVPESFSRAVNSTLSFPQFDSIKIQDMDDFLERLPKLPLILQPHDVSHHDWIRLTQDLSLAWAGKMPIPPERAANPPRRANVVAELLNAWNTAFFLPRGVEVVLYKGNVRFTGPRMGISDLPRTHNDDDDDDSTTSSSEESSEDEHFYGAPPQSIGLYGNPYAVPPTHPHYAAEVNDARRKRREEKAEKKRRRKERRMKRKQREKEKKFSLYIAYVPLTMSGPMPGGYPASRLGGY